MKFRENNTQGLSTLVSLRNTFVEVTGTRRFENFGTTYLCSIVEGLNDIITLDNDRVKGGDYPSRLRVTREHRR